MQRLAVLSVMRFILLTPGAGAHDARLDATGVLWAETTTEGEGSRLVSPLVAL